MKIEIRTQLLKNKKKFSNMNTINLDENNDTNERIKFKNNINKK